MKILVYDDNPDYGGHQVMASCGIEALVNDPAHEVIFMFNPLNRKLAERIDGISNLQKIESPCSTHKFQGLINRISKKKVNRLAQIFTRIKPDLILCIQGEIEDSSHAILAALKAEIQCISYLAIPHRMAEMGAKFGGLRDRINQYLLNQPASYITLSKGMANRLRERGVTKPIAIVPNGIPLPSPPVSKPKTSTPVLGLLGRIEFKQKQQDFMVNTFRSFPDQFTDCTLLIAGDGPDTEPLKEMIDGQRGITLKPWQEDTESFYHDIDYLLIPSRFEGVPLVMLEALARGIPVIGSNRDGMKDLLPQRWTFKNENGEDLANTFAAMQNEGTDEIRQLRQKICTEHSIESFQQTFYEVVVNN